MFTLWIEKRIDSLGRVSDPKLDCSLKIDSKIDLRLEERAEAARLMNKPSAALLHAARCSVTTGKCLRPL
jgi:hypothetical protein